MNAKRLRITEIFYSLQGESRTIGVPTVFVRLTGCPLRCFYCDTEYAFKGGRWWDLSEIDQTIHQYSTEFVTITGGEPLAQRACPGLLTRLCDQGYQVSLETGGTMDVSALDPRVIKVMDIKTPGSGEESKNLYHNIEYLQLRDQVKFVICDREDYLWARDKMIGFELGKRCEVLFSPSYSQLDASKLADWILEDQLKVRFQIQLHKLLWGEVPGH